MPRPQKGRRVCQMPINSTFGSSGSKADDDRTINLTVDEYEAIRLIDYVGCTQEECAKQMKVARSTVQGIYNDARRKVARFLVEATRLEIAGGYYELCDKRCGDCNFSPCSSIGFRRNMLDKDTGLLKIAVTYEDEQVCQHFGHTEKFKVYAVKAGRIQSSRVIETAGKGHGALAEILQHEDISVLICGGIGGGAKNALTEAGIQIFSGAAGDVDRQVESFLTGSLVVDSSQNLSCTMDDKESCKDYSCSSQVCS